MKRAGVIAAGESLPEPEQLLHLLDATDMVLCADGGFDVLLSLDREADLLLGDFDSSRVSPDNAHFNHYEKAGKVLRFPVKKDQTDTELALSYCLEQGFNEVLLFGAIGSRLDHSMINIAMMERFAKQGMSIIQYTENNCVRYLRPGTYRLPKRTAEWYTSFMLFSGSVRLSLVGFEYSLDREILEAGSSLGISNHILSEENAVVVESAGGTGVFCFQSRDRKTQG